MKDGVWECKENLEGFENAYNFKVTHALSHNESTEYKDSFRSICKGCIDRRSGLPSIPLIEQKKTFSIHRHQRLVIVEAHIRDF